MYLPGPTDLHPVLFGIQIHLLLRRGYGFISSYGFLNKIARYIQPQRVSTNALICILHSIFEPRSLVQGSSMKTMTLKTIYLSISESRIDRHWIMDHNLWFL